MREVNFERRLKHEELREVIRDAILCGEFQPEDRLPSQNELAEQYGLSHNSVREAVAALEHEGLLYRIQGKGTFVAERGPEYLTIGLVIPHLWSEGAAGRLHDMGYIGPLVRCLEEELKRNDANVLLCLDNDSVEGERENLTQLLARRVDGLVISYIGGETNFDCLARVEAAGIPMVFFDRYVEGIRANSVTTDNLLGAYRATQRLVQRGFPRVYWLTHTENSTSVRDRGRGHRQALEKLGLFADDLVVAFPPSSDIVNQRDQACEATRQLLATVEPPYAVLALNTPSLGGAWDALREAGRDHHDFALACFDEYPGELPDDVLFVNVLQPLREIGRCAAQMVLEAAAGIGEPRRVTLPPTIKIVGGSRMEALVSAGGVEKA